MCFGPRGSVLRSEGWYAWVRGVRCFGRRGNVLRSEGWATSVQGVGYFGPRGGTLGRRGWHARFSEPCPPIWAEDEVDPTPARMNTLVDHSGTPEKPLLRGVSHQ